MNQLRVLLSSSALPSWALSAPALSAPARSPGRSLVQFLAPVASTVVVCASLGCGGAHANAEAADVQASASASVPAPVTAAPAAEAPVSSAIPETCDKSGSLCLPSSAFVKKVCSSNDAVNVALYLFRKGTPFTRGYLTRNTQAWNASGGAGSSDQLIFDEEVIVLSERKGAAGGMQVSGMGGYDVIRWDGSCASLQTEELTFNLPPKAKHAKLDFHNFSDAIQDALSKNEKITKTNSDRRKECKGVTMGAVSAKCVTLVDGLSDMIVDYVRQGGDVPKPTKF